jgi:hypothetical protein
MLRGTVTNGKIVVDDPSRLIEGASVSISQHARKRQPQLKPKPSRAKPSSSAASLAKLAFGGCPTDMAEQHDHYASGAPKRPRTRKTAKYSLCNS